MRSISTLELIRTSGSMAWQIRDLPDRTVAEIDTTD
jgi:hypothetical protein